MVQSVSVTSPGQNSSLTLRRVYTPARGLERVMSTLCFSATTSWAGGSSLGREG
jgi:hypothetical protein